MAKAEAPGNPGGYMKSYSISIAFPQRDVHIHPGDVQAAMLGGKGSNGDAPA